MVYRIDDPYNQGIGTPDLGNMNLGQVPVNNMQLAKNLNVDALKNMEEYQKTFVPREPTGGLLDAIYNAEYNQIPKGISKYDFLKGINEGTFSTGGAGVFKENVGDLFPKGTFKGDWNTLGDADINLEQIPESYRYNIDVDTENIKGEVLEDLEKKGWFDTDDQASLEDEYADIEDQTASLINPATKKMWDMLRMYNAAKKIKKHGPKVLGTIGAITGGQTQAAPPSNINIQKKKIGMPENLTLGGGQNNQGPGGRARDRGRSRGRGETGQIAGGHHFKYGGRASYFDGGLASLWPR